MSEFGIYTKFTAQPGQGERLLERLLTAARLIGSAPGCGLYIVNASPDDTDTVWVTEVWDDAKDHAASLSMEGVSDLIQETLPLIAGAPEQIRLIPVGGKGLDP